MERQMDLREVKKKINESRVSKLQVELFNWNGDEDESGFDLMVNLLDSDGDLIKDMVVIEYKQEEEKQAQAEAKKIHKKLSEHYTWMEVKYTETHE
ncbi:hypothetical protein [Bacillus cereus]|uniref:Uncharacterized protein n=1 Tax=Bacillus cereus HuA3-9 TaxID=1053205 RepID=R8CIM3_BACCE|nr:hypothetical protein [Bacillus cereus]EOO11442.1 hypothetical protein IGA_05705 [Bacillus cereus HuA3-9]